MTNQGTQKSRPTQNRLLLHPIHKRSDFPLDGISGESILKDIEALKGSYEASKDLNNAGLASNHNDQVQFDQRSSAVDNVQTKPASRGSFVVGGKYTDYDDGAPATQFHDDLNHKPPKGPNRPHEMGHPRDMNSFDTFPMSNEEALSNSLRKETLNDRTLGSHLEHLQDYATGTDGGGRRVKLAYSKKTFDDLINGLKSEVRLKDGDSLPAYATDFQLRDPLHILKTIGDSRNRQSVSPIRNHVNYEFGETNEGENSLGDKQNSKGDMSRDNKGARRKTKVRKKGHQRRGHEHRDSDLDGAVESAMMAADRRHHGNHSVYHIDETSRDKVDLNVTQSSWLSRVHGHRDVITVGCVVVGLGVLLIVFAIINIIINKRRQSVGTNKNSNRRYRKLGTARERQSLKQKSHSLFPLSSSDDDNEDDLETEHNTDDELRLDPQSKM